MLHWITVFAFFTSLATGLRIAADAPNAVISRALDPILPQGEIWTVHFVASVVLTFCMAAYALYVHRSGVKRRNALKRLVVFTLPTAEKLRWAAVNVALHWVFFTLVLMLAVTGVFLYIGHGGWLVTAHTLAAFGAMIYVVVHLLSHAKYGGWEEILRILRPKRLQITRTVGSHALVYGVGGGLVLAAGLVFLDFGTRPALVVADVSKAPVLDGVLSEAVWGQARPVSIVTQQGTGLEGTGETRVEMRAVRHGDRITFAFRWRDPTCSMWRLPLQKREDGWHVLDDAPASADVTNFYEDKFAVAFSHSNAFGSGDSTHMGRKPLADLPSAANHRGLHYTTDGSYLDVWQWKASRGGMLGRTDDMHFGPPVEPTEDQWAGHARYSAGYAPDPGTAFYVYNFKTSKEHGYRGPIEVLRLPRDLHATKEAMGAYVLDSDTSTEPGSIWWLTDETSVPYAAARDADIPVGTVIPGVYITGEYSGDRADLQSGARWDDGHWTVEVTRTLTTGSKYDVDFNADEPIYLWVSAFDHNQTRHTRHARPVTLEFKPQAYAGRARSASLDEGTAHE